MRSQIKLDVQSREISEKTTVCEKVEKSIQTQYKSEINTQMHEITRIGNILRKISPMYHKFVREFRHYFFLHFLRSDGEGNMSKG